MFNDTGTSIDSLHSGTENSTNRDGSTRRSTRDTARHAHANGAQATAIMSMHTAAAPTPCGFALPIPRATDTYSCRDLHLQLLCSPREGGSRPCVKQPGERGAKACSAAQATNLTKEKTINSRTKQKCITSSPYVKNNGTVPTKCTIHADGQITDEPETGMRKNTNPATTHLCVGRTRNRRGAAESLSTTSSPPRAARRTPQSTPSTSAKRTRRDGRATACRRRCSRRAPACDAHASEYATPCSAMQCNAMLCNAMQDTLSRRNLLCGYYAHIHCSPRMGGSRPCESTPVSGGASLHAAQARTQNLM